MSGAEWTMSPSSEPGRDLPGESGVTSLTTFSPFFALV